MSNETVPVRPAKSNGCFGYIANTVTVPASSTGRIVIAGLPKLTVANHDIVGGETVFVPLQVCSWVVAAQPLYLP